MLFSLNLQIYSEIQQDQGHHRNTIPPCVHPGLHHHERLFEAVTMHFGRTSWKPHPCNHGRGFLQPPNCTSCLPCTFTMSLPRFRHPLNHYGRSSCFHHGLQTTKPRGPRQNHCTIKASWLPLPTPSSTSISSIAPQIRHHMEPRRCLLCNRDFHPNLATIATIKSALQTTKPWPQNTNSCQNASLRPPPHPKASLPHIAKCRWRSAAVGRRRKPCSTTPPSLPAMAAAIKAKHAAHHVCSQTLGFLLVGVLSAPPYLQLAPTISPIPEMPLTTSWVLVSGNTSCTSIIETYTLVLHNYQNALA